MLRLVINLDSRQDRWAECLEELKKLDGRSHRISGTSAEDLVPRSNEYLTPTVLACLRSHLKALEFFVDSNEEFCMILEDDFKLSPRKFPDFKSLSQTNKLDFLQVGYLKTSTLERFLILYFNYRASLIWILGKTVSRFSQKREGLLGKTLVKESLSYSPKLVPAEIRPGAHAYIVSRNFALEVSKILHGPEFLSADAFYISLGGMRSFRMARTKKIYFTQRKSPSSISQRFTAV